MQYTGIVFDFNGTLLWDSDKHEYAWRILSKQLRGQAFTDEEIRGKVHGRTNRVILEYLAGHALDDQTAAQLADQKEQIYLELCERDGEKFTLAPGAAELLDYLTEKRIPHAIGTSSCEPNVRYYLEKFDLLHWFPIEHIIFDDGQMQGKPAPDIYLRSAERLGVSPEKLIAVEDAVSGIRSAHAAGYGRVLAVVTEETRPDLENREDVDGGLVDFKDFDRNLLLIP